MIAAIVSILLGSAGGCAIWAIIDSVRKVLP